MSYSLTNKQKDALKSLVQLGHSWREEFYMIWHDPDEISDFLDLDGNPPQISRGDIKALERANLIICNFHSSNRAHVILTAKSYDAVDSDFKIPDSAHERDYLTRLRQILARRFNESELRTLCFDLDADYDSLSGAGKADKAREIVDYFDRRNRIPDLVEAVKEQRPDISLDDTSDKKSTASSLLEELLSKLPVIMNLDFYHPDFQTWHTMVKLSLRQVFGESSYLVTEYDKIAWHTSDRLEDADEQHKLFSRSCVAAEGLLRAAVNMQRRAT